MYGAGRPSNFNCVQYNRAYDFLVETLAEDDDSFFEDLRDLIEDDNSGVSSIRDECSDEPGENDSISSSDFIDMQSELEPFLSG